MDEFEQWSETEPLYKAQFFEDFKKRTKQFVLRSVKVFQALPKSEEARIFGKQFLRSASSVGANYRASCRARSKAEFHAKLSITVEEAGEALFWMKILTESKIFTEKRMALLMDEATEIIKVFSKARGTLSH